MHITEIIQTLSHEGVGKQAVPLYYITEVGKEDTQIRHKLETNEVKFQKLLSSFRKA